MRVPQDDPVLERLVAELQAGVRREENSAALFRRFQPVVFHFFRRSGFSLEQSADLVQEVMFRIFLGIEHFNWDSRFQVWVWRVAKNVYLNEIRRIRAQKRQGEEEIFSSEEAFDGGMYPLLEIVDQGIPVDELLVQKERHEALLRAIGSLPPQMKQVLTMRYAKGMKYVEIAHVLGISVETVKAHLNQGRRRLTLKLRGLAN